MSEITPIIIVQGGAGNYKNILKSIDLIVNGCKEASKAGYSVLLSGGSAIDAAITAVASLEDNELFNAGKGSHLTANKDVELDASLMDGKTLKAGGVTCVKHIKNPVKLSKVVMNKSSSILLDGEAAEAFARKHPEIEFTTNDYFETIYAKQRLEQHYREQKTGIKQEDVTMTNLQAETSDTVGAVAIDLAGNLAYATSTGGVVCKESGRIGDSCIVGCGGYADNNVCAVSTTGVGEAITKVSLAKHVHFLMEQGYSAQEASEKGVDYMKQKVGHYAGVITLSNSGETGIYFNSQGMLWTMIKNHTISWGLIKDEIKTEKLT